MVEVELKFNYETLSKISSQIHGKNNYMLACGLLIILKCHNLVIDLIVFHLESLADLRKELKRLPIAKVTQVLQVAQA